MRKKIVCSSYFCAPGCALSDVNNGIYNQACDNLACYYDFSDKNASIFNQVMFVDSNKTLSGDGSRSNPFNNLQEAIKRVRYSNTTIFLLSLENKLLKDPTGGLESLRKREYDFLTLKPYYCQEAETNCIQSGNYPIIYFSKELVNFTVHNTFTVENIIFKHNYSFAQCPTCSSCSELISNSLGN
jgi:hypothetical protein